MKSKCLILLVLIASCLSMRSQVVSTIPESFNTAVSPAPYTTIVPHLSSDMSWSVSTNQWNGYVPAKRYTSNTPPWQGISGSPSDWIIWPNFNCGPNPSDHACVGPQDLYFKITFNLTSVIFAVNFVIFADDKVVDVWVNTTNVWQPNGGGFAWNQAINFQHCSNWQLGANTIIIHTRSQMGFTGLKVESWPSVNMSINGNLQVCKNTTNPYTTLPVISPAPTNYVWTLPAGWGGGSNTSVINATASGTTGVMKVAAMSGSACLGITSKTITVVPIPTVNIVATPSAVCPGNCTTLTATGALTYTWVSPATNNNPLVVCPASPATYSVTGADANGCKNGNSLPINILPTSPINITAQPAVICSGITNTLTASGVPNYTWQLSPPGPVNSPLQVNLPITSTVINVAGTAANGCTSTAAITLTPGITIGLFANNATLCTDIAPCTTVAAIVGLPSLTFSWAPAPASVSQNVAIVCPTVSTVYTVTASSNSACPNSTTLAVTVQTCCPPPVETFSLPITTTCNTTFTNLASFASVQGVFSGIGVAYVGGVPVFNAAQNLAGGIYTVAFTYTTAPYGCTYVLTQTINVWNALPVSVNSPTICFQAFAGAMLSATVPAVAIYSWYPGGMTGPTVNVNPFMPTVYTVIAQYTGCESKAEATVSLVNTCCLQTTYMPLLGTQTLTAPGSLNGNIVIDQDVTISGTGNFTFRTGDFVFASYVKVIVSPGVNLILEDAHLYSCGNNRWTGIEVLDGGNVTSAPGPLGLSSFIEDAIVAIKVDNISANHATPLLDLEHVVFNNNSTSLFFGNSPLTHIKSSIKSCVFTNRKLPFSNLSWPGAFAATPQDLRYTNVNLATAMSEPYLTNPSYPRYYSQKQPFPPATGHVAIDVLNIGNIPGVLPTPGLDITHWANPTPGDFNLIDAITTGVRTQDASFTSCNLHIQVLSPVYTSVTTQYQGFHGFDASVSGLMNAGLYLAPPASNTNTGVHIWGNGMGVECKQTFEFVMEHGSIHRENSGPFGFGIFIRSNRFKYRIYNNTIANYTRAVELEFKAGPYNVGGAAGWGIYADQLNISRNYMGADIFYFALLPYPSNQLFYNGVTLSGDSSVNWNVQSTANYIQSNIMDRSFCGIIVRDISNYPLEISNNKIRSDYGYINSQGITVTKALNSLTVKNNTVSSNAPGPGGQGICYAIGGCPNAIIECNQSEYNHTGFALANKGYAPLRWRGNRMLGHIAGLILSGPIGPQGNPSQASGNQWLGSWQGNVWQTYVALNCNAATSPLYVNPGSLYLPTLNTCVTPNTSYNVPGNLQVTNAAPFTCPPGNYPPFPQLYTNYSRSEPTGITEAETGSLSGILVYPNPSNGKFRISLGDIQEELMIKIFDLTGKIVYSQSANANEGVLNFDLALDNGIYFVNLSGKHNAQSNHKLVVSK